MERLGRDWGLGDCGGGLEEGEVLRLAEAKTSERVPATDD